MTQAEKLYSRLSNREFSYGESISLIMENRGKTISTVSSGSLEEDFVFPDNSVLRVTNVGVTLLEFLAE